MTATDRDRLAADLHEHWLGHPYVRGEFVFAPCTCGEHVHVPAVTVENRDPVLAFSEHVADRLIALGWTRLDAPSYEVIDKGGSNVEVQFRRVDAIDEERLARALDACLPEEFNRHQPGNKTRAAAIAKAYREDAG